MWLVDLAILPRAKVAAHEKICSIMNGWCVRRELAVKGLAGAAGCVLRQRHVKYSLLSPIATRSGQRLLHIRLPSTLDAGNQSLATRAAVPTSFGGAPAAAPPLPSRGPHARGLAGILPTFQEPRVSSEEVRVAFLPLKDRKPPVLASTLPGL